ncbi:MAG: hypothetical protein KGM17_11660 [Sphingomonadales bacterium]|nr:hypothetical protein [Sphingomonadales bacterium]
MSDHVLRFSEARAVAEANRFRDVISAADAWNCRCGGSCSTIEAARCLYTSTLEELSAGRDGAALANTVIGPLAVVVAGLRSVEGQAVCQDYIRALQAGEQVAALAACRHLVEMADPIAPRGWDDLPGHV